MAENALQRALDDIEKRANAATPGPWATQEHNAVITNEREWEGFLFVDHIAECETEADAEFIAAARTDIPRLVAALRAVEALEQDWRALSFKHRARGTQAIVAERDALRAQVASIRKVVVDWGAGTVHRPRSLHYRRLRDALEPGGSR